MEVKPRLFAHVDRFHGACALRLDHVQVLTPRVRDCLEFYNGMGFSPLRIRGQGREP